MSNCPSCSASVEPGSWFCPQCAFQLSSDDDLETTSTGRAEAPASANTRETLLELPGVREVTKTLAWAPAGRTFTGEALILGELDPSRRPEPTKEVPLGAVLPTGDGALKGYLLYSETPPRQLSPGDVPALASDASDAVLTPYERYLTTYINGRRSLRDLQEAALLTPEEIVSTLLVLMDRGLVRLVREGGGVPREDTTQDVDPYGLHSDDEPTAHNLEVLPPGLDLLSELGSPAGLEAPVEPAPPPMLSSRWLTSPPWLDSPQPLDAPPEHDPSVPPPLDPSDLLPLEDDPTIPTAEAAGLLPPAPAPMRPRGPTPKAAPTATPRLVAPPTPNVAPARASNAAAPVPSASAPRPPRSTSHMAMRAPNKRALEREKAKELFAAAQRDRAAGNLVAARMNLKLAIAFDPENAAYQEVFRALEKIEVEPAAMPTPKNPLAARLYGEADAAEAQGDIDRAMRLLERALNASREAIILNRLGVVLAMRKRDLAAARLHLEAAVELAPDNQAYLQNLTKVLSALAVVERGRAATKPGIITRAAQLWDRLRKKSLA